MSMYSKYLIAQTVVLFLIGSFFGPPGIFIAGVLTVVFYFIIREVKKVNEQQLDKTEKKNDSPQAIKIKENENISDVDMQAEGEIFRANMADSMPIRSKGAGFSFEIEDVLPTYVDVDTVVITGSVKGGKVKVGDLITIQTTLGEINTQLLEVHLSPNTIGVACSGERVGLVVRGVASHEIQRKSTIFMRPLHKGLIITHQLRKP
jgi:translation elongation factor EF-Tu-like GTPase